MGGIDMGYFVRLSIAASAAIAVSVAAQAADLGPPISKAPVTSWTGFYIGGSAGYGWSNSEVDPAATGALCNALENGCLPSNVLTNAQVAAVPPALLTHPTGGLLGGQIGYNYQVGSMVVGLEADLSWTSIEGSDSRGGPVPIVGFSPDTVASSATADQRLRYLGTVRARAGYLPFDSLLAYVTGGLAYGQIASTTSISESFSANLACNIGTSFACDSTSTALGSTSTTRAGWTVGGGLEYMFAQNWSLRGEYLYFNLGSVSYAAGAMTAINEVNNGTSVGTTASTVAVASRTTDFTGSIVRVGVNYKLGGNN
jgi:outer membrane immunogenic protein